jgi:large subunit ribosomal protein L13
MGYTRSANAATLNERWYVVDAENAVLGRLASQIAHVLRGKHLPEFTPHVSMKTHVVVVNAEKVRLTGNKQADKKYYRHSGWVGGIKETTAGELNEKKPGDLVRLAVKGMLPGNKLGRQAMTRLRIFAGPAHHHQAQKPEPLPERLAPQQA